MKDVSFLDDMLAPVSQPEQVDSPFKMLPLDQIDLDPNQPRKHMDEAALQEMADSILQYGILQPVTVTLQGDRYRLVTGERRYRAALLASGRGDPCAKDGYDLSYIPALVADAVDDLTRLEQQLVENLAREDMSPVDTGRAFQQILDKTGESASALARRVGKSAAWVRQILAFAQPELLPKLERLGVDSAEVPVALAQSLIACSEKDLDWMQAQIAAGQTLDRELVDAAASRAEDDATQIAAEPEPEPEPEATEEPEAQESASLPVTEVSTTADDAPEADDAEYGEGFGPAGEAATGAGPDECAGSPAESTYGEGSTPDEDTAPVEQAGEESPSVSVYPVDADVAITLPESVWRAFLDKAGVMGAVNAYTVQQAIDALSS